MPTGAFTDQLDVVTGAGRGIGRAVALGFAANGALRLLARRPQALTPAAVRAAPPGAGG